MVARPASIRYAVLSHIPTVAAAKLAAGVTASTSTSRVVIHNRDACSPRRVQRREGGRLKRDVGSKRGKQQAEHKRAGTGRLHGLHSSSSIVSR